MVTVGDYNLQVGPTGNKSWLFRFMLAGKAREMGLGAVADLSLAEARETATAARRLVKAGTDPIEARQATRITVRYEQARSMTFSQCAEAYIAAHEASWRNPKHRQQWRNTMATYCGPVFGELPVDAIDLALVLKVLEPMWHTKTETASRLRGRIENILDWATVRGYREGDNPSRWRGHLDKLLPARSKVQTVEHHAALPYDDIPAFMADLRSRRGVSARALEFCVLTATRTSESIGASWSEIDLANKAWTIPAVRIKAGKDHRVPLVDRVVEILSDMAKVREGEHVFPGGKLDKPLSTMAFLMLLRRMERPDLTAHGFRSTFRDWAAERTAYPREVAEMCLAHAIGDKVEAAYRRGDLFEKRRQLMEAWATHCEGWTGEDNVLG